MKHIIGGVPRTIDRVTTYFKGGNDIDELSMKKVIKESGADKLYLKEVDKKTMKRQIEFSNGDTDYILFPGVDLTFVGGDKKYESIEELKKDAIATELLYAKRAESF